MEGILLALRTKATENTAKKSVGLSFAGESGYEALEYLNNSKKFGCNKSTLIVELLLVLKNAEAKFGTDALDELKKIVDLEK